VRILTINIDKDFERQLTKMHIQIHIAVHADTELLCNQIASLFQPGVIKSVEFETME